MTPRQALALKLHCRLAGETAHPRYGKREASGDSSLLTVNSGYE
jgi:hypothetical protein